MPIRESEKHRYPTDWPAISALARAKAGNKCQDCGLKNGLLGGRDKGGRWHDAHPTGTDGMRLTWPRPGEHAWCAGDVRLKIVRIVLTVGHKDHCPEHNDPKNHRVWCQQCHLRYDAKHKAAGLKERRRATQADRDLFADIKTLRGPEPYQREVVSALKDPRIKGVTMKVRRTPLILPLLMRPLFIPLKREYFEAFERGEKTAEWRPYGPRWNARTCLIGRRATLSLGYGKGRRLCKMITAFAMMPAAPGSPARKLFPRVKRFAVITLGDQP